MADSNRLAHRIALTRIPRLNTQAIRQLLQELGDELALFHESKQALQSLGLRPESIAALHSQELLSNTAQEVEFAEQNGITPLFVTDADYPQRLHECLDAPLLLFSKGNVNLNARKTVAIVGTRNATSYATDFCETFIAELSKMFPHTLIVSGLAYGVDIQAHRAALKAGLPTVGVLAHGLDRIYPAGHRRTADDMLENGGLLTEFRSKTNPDRHNFVMRNRIVAGLADAVVVLESAAKGGSLITADIAASYYRDVFALPGRVGAPQSEGCNKLIADNKAVLLQSASDFVRQMGWGDYSTKPAATAPLQRELLLDLSPEEQAVYQALQREELQVNLLAIESKIAVSKLFPLLLAMEMRGIVKTLPGSVYKLA